MVCNQWVGSLTTNERRAENAGERSERMTWNEPANKAARTALSVGIIKTRNAPLGAFLLEKIYPNKALSAIKNAKSAGIPTLFSKRTLFKKHLPDKPFRRQ